MSSLSLIDQALGQLYENLAQDTFAYNEAATTGHKKPVEKNATWSFSTPCESLGTAVQESSSTLLAARAFAKAGNVTLAWESLGALFTGQRSEDGFLPKYRYSNHRGTTAIHNASDDHDYYYINQSTIPGPKLASDLSALPLHASVILDVYAWSAQSKHDLAHLVDFYIQIYKYHEYLMEHPIWHPWETLWDVHSWVDPLHDVREHIRSIGWTVPFDIPPQVWQSYDFLPEVYGPCLYLLECKAKSKLNNNTSTICPSVNVSTVEYASIWVQANRDLVQMRSVLDGRHQGYSLQDYSAELPTVWLASAEAQLERLWSKEHQSYLPMQNNKTLVMADASNFVGLWSLQDQDDDRVHAMSFKLMQHTTGNDEMDTFAFDCGAHAVWSQGGCKPTSTISPLLNYFISSGLIRNDVSGMGIYIANATTNYLFPDNMTSDFAIAFDATTGQPVVTRDICSFHSTITAAAVYNLATPSPPLIFHPDPPIRRSGVIVLIVVEVVVAFLIGASCVLLNLRILRQALRDDEEQQQDYQRLEQEDGGFFSAAGSVAGHDGAAITTGSRDDLSSDDDSSLLVTLST